MVEIYSERVPLLKDIAHCPNSFIRVCRSVMILFGDGRVGKVAGKYMRASIF